MVLIIVLMALPTMIERSVRKSRKAANQQV